MSDLSADDRKQAQLAFNRGMVPGFALCFVGALLNVVVKGGSIAVPIASLVLIIGGMTIGLVMGYRRRRAFIASLPASRRGDT